MRMYSILITESVHDYYTAPMPEGVSIVVRDEEEVHDIIDFCIAHDMEAAVSCLEVGGDE